jgi:hypothetical protein
MDLTDLGQHLDRCNGSRGHWFTLQCVAQTIHRVLAPRLVTTLIVIALLIGVATLLL